MMGTLHEASAAACRSSCSIRSGSARPNRFTIRKTGERPALVGRPRVVLNYRLVGGHSRGSQGHHEGLHALDDGAAPRARASDHEFIAAHTHGFEAFPADLRAAEWSAIEVARAGCRAIVLTSVAEAYAKSNATIVSYGMGIHPAQHG